MQTPDTLEMTLSGPREELTVGPGQLWCDRNFAPRGSPDILLILGRWTPDSGRGWHVYSSTNGLVDICDAYFVMHCHPLIPGTP